MSKILYIFSDGLEKETEELMRIHAEDNDIDIVDLSQPEPSYELIVDKIEASDKVMSW